MYGCMMVMHGGGGSYGWLSALAFIGVKVATGLVHCAGFRDTL